MPIEDKTAAPGPCFGLWQRRRRENPQKGRYYEARVLKNLFGEWEVFCVWGDIGTRRGGSKVIPSATAGTVQETLAKIDAKRLKRRYLPVKTC